MASFFGKALTNLLVAAAAVIMAFGLGEIVVRAMYKDETTLFPRYHTDYRYGKFKIRGIRQNSDYNLTSVDGVWRHRTNSKGLRDTREFAYVRPEGVFRVLTLGDSHTQGYEARQEHTFSAVLERHLTKHRGPSEVINAGVSGFGTAEQLVFLENEGVRYAPDAVVVGFYANDLEDNIRAGLFDVDSDGRLMEKKSEYVPGVRTQNVIYAIPPVRWLSENSYFYSILFNRLWYFARSRLTSAASAEYAVPTANGYSDLQVALAQALLLRMKRFCADRQIEFVVVDIPRVAGPFGFATSMPDSMRRSLQAAGVKVFLSSDLLGGYRGVAEIHVPHGHRHISEFTHAMIGVKVGEHLAGDQSAANAVGRTKP